MRDELTVQARAKGKRRCISLLALVVQVASTTAYSRGRAQDVTSPPADAAHLPAGEERRAIDARIGALEVQRTQLRIGGPIALMSSGYAVGGILLVGAALGAGILTAARGGWDERGSGWDAYRPAVVVASVAVAPLAAGVAGHVWFLRRLRARRTLDWELAYLRRRRLQLPSVQPQLGPSSLGIRLMWRL